MENDLKIRLEQHAMWLLDETRGQRFVAKKHENLRYADLSSSDLRYANLSYADLGYADLSSSDLSFANLSYTNLRSANLSSSDLSYANLHLADGFKFVPIQVVNTKFFITILDDHVLWGCLKMTFDEVKAFRFSDCTTVWDKNEFNLNKKIITEMIQYYRK